MFPAVKNGKQEKGGISIMWKILISPYSVIFVLVIIVVYFIFFAKKNDGKKYIERPIEERIVEQGNLIYIPINMSGSPASNTRNIFEAIDYWEKTTKITGMKIAKTEYESDNGSIYSEEPFTYGVRLILEPDKAE